MVSETKAMKGNFTYIGLDIDTTGRRLIDEVSSIKRGAHFEMNHHHPSGSFFSQIVNIAAYTPDSQYSQHIMPLMNLNIGARKRHEIRVINVGCFRMLKCMQTYKVRTRGEVIRTGHNQT